ncbi:MAG: hypothetical protein V2J13_08090, partial [Cycloclasticus sp.]|nr:hypothetical protein [Cycloclasticus sp.]
VVKNEPQQTGFNILMLARVANATGIYFVGLRKLSTSLQDRCLFLLGFASSTPTYNKVQS